jgi:glycine/serine hydroxymethyltransferase
MKEEEMLDIADLINDALHNRDDQNALDQIRAKIRELTRRFPLPS